ncbi:MAG: T9SS type A sorting domain-containing protein [Bacteroidota bacterium]
MKYIFYIILSLLPFGLLAQSNLIVENNNFVLSGGFLVLDDANFKNDGTFNHTDGTVKMVGSQDSKIEGAAATTFYQLLIQKTLNNVLLDQNVTVTENLELAGGLLDLQTSDLELIGNATTVTGPNANRYIKTSSTGVLIIAVGANAVFFPVGNSAYNPATLSNAGTADDFNVRVADEVLTDGNAGVAFTSGVVDRTWFINEAIAGGSDVNMTLQWNGNEELTSFDRLTAHISRFDNAWDVVLSSGAVGSNPYTLDRSNITDFSPFSIGNDNVLPVELLTFKGRALEEAVLLAWTTATEINNKGFFLERSEDSKAWKSLGFVEGQGNSLAQHDYDFLDKQPIQGIGYYRLKQVDFDESFEYSNIIAIEFGDDKASLSDAFPNPTNDYTQLDLTLPKAEQVIVDIYDAVGRHLQRDVQAFPVGISNIVLTTEHLAAGTYYVRVLLDQKMFQRMVVVERQ